MHGIHVVCMLYTCHIYVVCMLCTCQVHVSSCSVHVWYRHVIGRNFFKNMPLTCVTCVPNPCMLHACIYQCKLQETCATSTTCFSLIYACYMYFIWHRVFTFSDKCTNFIAFWVLFKHKIETPNLIIIFVLMLIVVF